MSEKKLKDKIAKLESINDLLSAEIRHLHQIAMKLGFPEGLKTLKEAAMELIELEENWENFPTSKEDEKNPPKE